MFDKDYLDYEYYAIASKDEPVVETRVTLRVEQPADGIIDFGSVYTEKHRFKDFLETEYTDSLGLTVKNQILPDGTRMTEHHDAAEGKYRCSIFNDKGILLYKETAENNGKYSFKQRQTDGSMYEISGQSIFIRCFNGKMIWYGVEFIGYLKLRYPDFCTVRSHFSDNFG